MKLVKTRSGKVLSKDPIESAAMSVTHVWNIDMASSECGDCCHCDYGQSGRVSHTERVTMTQTHLAELGSGLFLLHSAMSNQIVEDLPCKESEHTLSLASHS